MVATGTLQVLVVTDEPTLSQPFAGDDDVSVVTRRPEDAADAVEAVDPDCLVVTDPADLDGATVAEVERRGTPVVAYTGAPAESFADREYLSGYVRRRGDADDDSRRLLDELRWVTSRETRAGNRQDTDRVTALHDATAALVSVETPEELYESTVAVADDVLEFDICYVGIVEGEHIVPKAVSADASADGARRMHVDEGLAGKTYRTGESQLVHRVGEDDDTDPARPEYQSGISVPIGDHGVFQAVSTQPAAFDERDLELAELLIGHVAEMLTRLRTEVVMRNRQAKITRLHEGVADLVAARSREDLFERTVGVAEDILGFDLTYVFVREGEKLVPVAKSTPPDSVAVGPLSLDHGAVGDTFRTGESRLTPDIHADPEANPVDGVSGSGISVRIDGVGVFQAVARDSAQFDEVDLELAELLISHVTATIKRIEAESGLRSERDRLDALFENVPDAAVAFEFDDGAPVVQRINTTFERVFGYTADELVGEDIDEFVVPPSGASEATTFNEKLQTGTNLRTEVRRTTADGVRDFLLHVVPIRLDERNAGGYAIYTDVTAQKERERELRRQNERLDEFASIVSHDLRNPLTVANGYLGLARERSDDPNLGKVDDALGQMERLVEGLLRLARKGQVVGETTPVDLGTAATEAWSHVETAAVELVTGLDGVTVSADRDRLVDLLQNLFRNAVEHGSPTVTSVRVEATDRGFAVEDDGVGIPEPERPSVLETGYTTDDGGTGFGLAIVRRIAEAHGWTVTVTEGTDGGARFEFAV